MSAPTVRAVGTATNGTDAAPAFAVSAPAGVTTGDLLIAFAVNDTTGTAWTASPGNGWVQLSDEVQGSTHRLAVYAVIADGSDTLSIAAANNNDYSAVMLAITVGTHTVTNVATQITIPAAATAATGNADPPASGTVTLSDYLAVAACGLDFTNAGDAVSAAPTNYTTGAVLTKSAASTSSVGLGVGYRQVTGITSENPGTFTNTSRPWVAKTLLIPGINPNATVTPATIAVSFAPVVPVVIPQHGSRTPATIAAPFTLPTATATGGGGGGGVLASDDFNRSNTTPPSASGAGLGSNWTDTESGGQHYINTNRMTQTSGDHWCKHVTTMGGPDHYVEADIQGTEASNFVLVNARGPASTLANCYMLLANGTTLELASQVGGTYTPLDTASITMGANQTGRLRLECEGTTIRGYFNDTLEITVTGNTDVTTGNFVGVNAFATDPDEVFIDNFEAGTLGGGGDGEASPAVIAAPFALPAPAASGEVNGTATPAVVTAPFAVPAATAVGGGNGTGTPAVIARAWTLPPPALEGGHTLTPAVITSPWTLPAATPSGGGGGGGGTIGYYNAGAAGGSTDTTADNWLNEALVGAAQRYTAVSGDVVTSVSVYGGGDGTCEVGVYTYVGGVPVTKVGSTNISVGTADQVWSTTGLSWALTGGTVYVAAIDWTATLGAFWTIHYDDPGGGARNTSIGTGQAALPSTWTEGGEGSGLGSFYATVTGSGGGVDGTGTPAAISAPFTLPAPTSGGSGSAAPAVIARSWLLPAPALSAGSSSAPATIASAWTFPAVEGIDVTVEPAVIARAWLLPAPTATGSTTGTANPATIARAWTLPAPTATADGSAAPATISRSWTLPAPAATAGTGGTASPAAIAVAMLLPAAAASGGALMAPAVLVVSVAMPAAAAGGTSSGTATPATIARAWTLPAPAKVAGSTATPNRIVVLVTLPAVHIPGTPQYLNITLTALSPMLAHTVGEVAMLTRIAGGTVTVSQAAGDVALAHTAGDPVFIDQEPGDPALAHDAGEPTIRSRIPGEPTI